MKVGQKDLDWLKNLLKNGSYLLTLFLFGLVMILSGVIIMKNIDDWKDEDVEIIELDEEKEEKSNIFVDVSGAVINPGLYELKFGSKVNDVLVKAGGISEKADREWFGKNINLAQELKDGVKIYVLFEGESNNSESLQGEESLLTDKINVNTASLSELEDLWGIGPVTAKEIIDARPFGSVDELQDILNSNVYEKNKDKLSVF